MCSVNSKNRREVHALETAEISQDFEQFPTSYPNDSVHITGPVCFYACVYSCYTRVLSGMSSIYCVGYMHIYDACATILRSTSTILNTTTS